MINRQLAFLLTAQVTSAIGSTMAPVALAFGVLGTGRGAASLGTVLFAQALPSIVLLLFGGIAADRWPRIRIMRGCNVVSCLSQVSLGVALLNHASLLTLSALAVVSGAASAFYQPAAQSVVPNLVATEHLQRANTVLRSGTNAARLAGPVVSGLLVPVLGSGWVLVFDGVTFAISFTVLGFVRIAGFAKPRKGLREDLNGGWRILARRRWLRICFAQITLGSMAWMGGFLLLGPVVVANSVHWGAIVSSYAVGMLLGGVILWRWHPDRVLLICFTSPWLLVLPLTAMGFGLNVYVTAVAAALAGIGLEIGVVLWSTAKQLTIQDDELGRAASFDMLGGMVLSPLAYLAFGVLAERTGAAPVVLLCAAITALSTVPVLLTGEVRTFRRSQPDRIVT